MILQTDHYGQTHFEFSCLYTLSAKIFRNYFLRFSALIPYVFTSHSVCEYRECGACKNVTPYPVYFD
jgi:hypothetical protein